MQTLELSHSNLPSVDNLTACTGLTSLNLSHNRIGSLICLRQVPTIASTRDSRHTAGCPLHDQVLLLLVRRILSRPAHWQRHWRRLNLVGLGRCAHCGRCRCNGTRCAARMGWKRSRASAHSTWASISSPTSARSCGYQARIKDPMLLTVSLGKSRARGSGMLL